MPAIEGIGLNPIKFQFRNISIDSEGTWTCKEKAREMKATKQVK
jgi:hypothetical protein